MTIRDEVILGEIGEKATFLKIQNLQIDHQWLDLMLCPFSEYIEAAENEDILMDSEDATGAAILAAHYARLDELVDFGTWYLCLSDQEFQEQVHLAMAQHLPYEPDRKNHNYKTANPFDYSYLPAHFYGFYKHEELLEMELMQNPQVQNFLNFVLDNYQLANNYKAHLCCCLLEDSLRHRAKKLDKEARQAYLAIAEFFSFCFTSSKENYLFHHTLEYYEESWTETLHWGLLEEIKTSQIEANQRYKILCEGVQLLSEEAEISKALEYYFKRYYPLIQELEAKPKNKKKNPSNYESNQELREMINDPRFRRRIKPHWRIR